MPDYTTSREKACQTIVFMEFSGLTWPIGKDGWSGGRESNPRRKLGKLLLYH